MDLFFQRFGVQKLLDIKVEKKSKKALIIKLNLVLVKIWVYHIFLNIVN